MPFYLEEIVYFCFRYPSVPSFLPHDGTTLGPQRFTEIRYDSIYLGRFAFSIRIAEISIRRGDVLSSRQYAELIEYSK